MLLTVDENNFSNEVLESSIPVIVSFWAPWCGLCRIMNPLLTNLQSEQGSTLKLVSVNADENLKLANAYRLKTLPTLLLIQGGEVLHRFDQFSSHEDLRAALGVFRDTLATIAVQYSCVS